jgi:hypothetical protein
MFDNHQKNIFTCHNFCQVWFFSLILEIIAIKFQSNFPQYKMNGLGPDARKRQQMMLQSNRSPNQRQTRQFDSSKNSRTTFNSRNEKLLNIDQDVANKKKQKLQHSNNNIIPNIVNSSSLNNDCNSNSDSYNKIVPPSIVGKNTPTVSNDNVASSEEDYDSDGNKEISGIQQYVVSQQGILGDGHTHILHAYVRETLFKNIKILSPTHLETNGEIMREILRLLKYNETKNGNFTAFCTACRMEIRKTMCSRRGYVKRQTGITVAGKV